MPDLKRSSYPDAAEYNRSTAAADELQQLTAAQIVAAVGGPTHEGHDHRLSPEEMDSSRNARAALSRDLAAILDKFKITDQVRTEVMAVLASSQPQAIDD